MPGLGGRSQGHQRLGYRQPKRRWGGGPDARPGSRTWTLDAMEGAAGSCCHFPSEGRSNQSEHPSAVCRGRKGSSAGEDSALLRPRGQSLLLGCSGNPGVPAAALSCEVPCPSTGPKGTSSFPLPDPHPSPQLQHLTPTAPEAPGRLPPFLWPLAGPQVSGGSQGQGWEKATSKLGGRAALPGDLELPFLQPGVKGLWAPPPQWGLYPTAPALPRLSSGRAGMGGCSYQVPSLLSLYLVAPQSQGGSHPFQRCSALPAGFLPSRLPRTRVRASDGQERTLRHTDD